MSESMYVMARGGGPHFRATAAWLFESAESLWANKDVQLRLHTSVPENLIPNRKDPPDSFEEFLTRLENGEMIMLGWNIVGMWKCSGCKPAAECAWHRLIKRTSECSAAHEELSMGANSVSCKDVIVNPLLGQD